MKVCIPLNKEAKPKGLIKREKKTLKKQQHKNCQYECDFQTSRHKITQDRLTHHKNQSIVLYNCINTTLVKLFIKYFGQFKILRLLSFTHLSKNELSLYPK